MKNTFKNILTAGLLLLLCFPALASSHREAPLIADDPLADNVDVYAFRSPNPANTVTLIATYVPVQLPQGGPNYYSFGENIRYEIHIDNDPAKPGDEIIYRVEFQMENEDPTTFFNIRLGKQNLKMTYTLYRSDNGGKTFAAILVNRPVPPTNIGARSISSPIGLGKPYQQIADRNIVYAATGERVFVGPVDDPFFVDLGGVFDLGDLPRQNGQARDGLACKNVSAIAIQVPIGYLLKKGAPKKTGQYPRSQLRDRRMGQRQPPANPHAGSGHGGILRPLGTGKPSRDAADQRGRHPGRF